jgi:hypothetical protein
MLLSLGPLNLFFSNNPLSVYVPLSEYDKASGVNFLVNVAKIMLYF